MRAGMLAFSIGIIVAGYLPRMPSAVLLSVATCAALVLLLLQRTRVAGAALCGCCYLVWWGQVSLQHWLPDTDEVQDRLVQARVWSVPVALERGWRLQLRIEAACQDGATPRCSALPWHARRLVQVTAYEQQGFAPGQRWQLLLRLRRPHGFVNPGGFDYEAWLLQQGVASTGYVRNSVHHRQLTAAAGRPWFQRLRWQLSAELAQLPAPPFLQAGLIKALSLGLHQELTDAQWELFSRLGLNHLVVISGLHLALVAGMLYQAGQWTARLWPTLLLGATAPRCGAALALAGAWLYAGLAGFSLPVVRALVMALMYFSGTLLQRQTRALDSLQLSLCLVLLLDPLAPQSAGFWLSFVAVALLLGQGSDGAAAFWQRIWRTIRLQVLLGLGMLPVMLVFFQQGSALAPVANLAAIPYVGLLAVPACLAGLLLLGVWPAAAVVLLRLADFLLDEFMRAAAALSALWPGSLLTLPPLSLPLLLAGCVTTLLLLLPHATRRWSWGGAALVAVLLAWPPRRLQHAELDMTVLDVGQGLAVLVSTRHQQLLYDTGPRFSERFDAGADVLLPALRRLGVSQLDLVVVSHADLDHAGGLAAIAQAFPDARFLGSDLTVFDPALDAARCQPLRWRRDGFEFALLHPDDGRYSDNDASCVLHISGSNGSILLPGDIGRAIEARLLQQTPGLNADILVAPHHGSKTSSSSAFIRRLAPQDVIFSSGYLNRFGHPAGEVQARYDRAGVTAWNTAADGALRVRVRAGRSRPEVAGLRTLRPRFSYQRPGPAAQ